MKASTRARGPPDGPSVSGRPHCFSSRGTSTPGSNSKAVAHPAGTWCRNNRSTSRAALSAPAAAAVAATSSSVEGGQAVRAAAAAAPAAAVDLTGRDVAILLDIENVGIFAPLDTCLIQVHRLRSLVTERWGGRLERFAAAANTTTVARLRQSGAPQSQRPPSGRTPCSAMIYVAACSWL